jgi:hypothetical protein
MSRIRQQEMPRFEQAAFLASIILPHQDVTGAAMDEIWLVSSPIALLLHRVLTRVT